MKVRNLLAVLACTTATGALAQGHLPENIAVAEILPGWRTADGYHHAALSITLAPGWKTYWRTPGAAGIPPVFDWSASRNISNVTVDFPVPDVFVDNGMRSIGYENQVVFPLTLHVPKNAETVSLKGEVTIGVCEDICIPMDFRINADLGNSHTTPTHTITAAHADRPLTPREARAGRVACDIVPISDGLRLTAKVELPALGRIEAAVIELPDREIWISEATTRREGNYLVAEAEIVPPDARPFALARQDVRLTVFGGGHAVDLQGCR